MFSSLCFVCVCVVWVRCERECLFRLFGVTAAAPPVLIPLTQLKTEHNSRTTIRTYTTPFHRYRASSPLFPCVMFRRFVSSSSVLFGGRSAAIGRTAVGTIAAAAAAGAAITMAMANNTIVQAQSSSEVSSSNTADVEAPSNYPVNIDLNRFLPDRPPNLTLRGLLFVTRHGSRTPVSLLPGQTHDEFRDTWHNCPLGDHSTVPCSGGLLTHFGEFQLSSVGWHMRQRYVHTDGFLPTKFDSTFFQLRSTDLPRTQLSLARMLQGLYPSLSLETLGPLIEVRKQKDETMYPNHYFCPRLKEMYIEAWSDNDERRGKKRVCV